MDENSLLDFEYPRRPLPDVDAERRIKRLLRSTAFNLKTPREVERHSDMPERELGDEEIRQMLIMEIMGPELQKIHGANIPHPVNVIPNDVEEGEGSSVSKSDGWDTQSLGGGDDYHENYFQDDSGDADNCKEEVF